MYLICLNPVQRLPVLLAVDRHAADAELSAGSENSDGDLSPVCHQYLRVVQYRFKCELP